MGAGQQRDSVWVEVCLKIVEATDLPVSFRLGLGLFDKAGSNLINHAARKPEWRWMAKINGPPAVSFNQKT